MRRLILAALMVAASGAWFAAPAHGESAQYNAAIVNFAFEHGSCGSESGSGSFTVHVGDSITWTNCTSDTNHTVTIPKMGNDTTDVLPGGTKTYVFNTADSFPYKCVHHPSMTGTITVVTATATTTTTTTEAPATTQPPAATTTAKPTTTTSSTVRTTTTTEDISGVFSQDTTPTDPTTTLFTTETTRALGGGGSGTSAGLVAALVVGLGAVGTVVALIIRRMRVGTPPS